jgi:phenylacetic acid degradation operon negative regulatory protein
MDDQLRLRSIGAPAARKILITLLGEYVLPAPDGVWQETLVKALNTMGYKTHAARQALARSAGADWIRTERRGRRSRIYLTDNMAELLRRGGDRIFGFGQPQPWDGRWLLVTLRVPEEQRDVRHLLRSQLAWAGFGSLGNGLWITPHAQREDELETMARGASAAELLSFRAELGRIGEPKRVVAEAWDLDAVASAYREFIDRFRRVNPKTPETVFRAQTELVHAWGRFPYLDPDLPEEMLPSRWPRSRARRVFEERHADWQEPAQEYFRTLDSLNSQGPGRLAA